MDLYFKNDRIVRGMIMKKIEIENERNTLSNKEFLNIINDFIDNLINKDKRYYSKLKSYNFNNEILKYLM